MYLDAIDYNEACPKLQVRLPDLGNVSELADLAARWSNTLTAFGLVKHNIGCLGGWLPFTVAPNVSNQADYFLGHYQSHGLNVRAMCDSDLLFLYIAVAAPGKVND